MEQEKQKNESKTKWNWKILILSIVLYYIIEISLSFLFPALSININRFYIALISLVVAIYFYQTRKNRKELKKDLILVSVAGLTITVLLTLAYLL